MATTTPRFNLRKPAGSDLVDETADISDNMDKIDLALFKTHELDVTTGPNNQLFSIEALIPGLSIVFTPTSATRRYEMIVKALLINDANPGRILGHIRLDAVNHDRWCDFEMVANGIILVSTSLWLTSPSATPHTVDVTLKKETGLGSVAINNGSRCEFILKDIGSTV